MFALVDCNNFYASCERVFNPNLKGKPVAILSNNDGCIISRSDEAKAIGLPMGAPLFKWDAFCKQNNVTILSSNYPLYGDMSSRVMSILKQFTPDLELYSIDESFLELKNFKEDFNYNDYANKIKARILKWTGIPTCVGIGPTKALSKVANKIARKNINKSGGICVINTEEKRVKALQWINIEDVWGIGRRLEKRLKLKGCTKAYHFTQLPDDWVYKNFSITEWKLKKDLEGVPTLGLNEHKIKQAIATTRSFDRAYSDVNYIKERISTFAVSCAEKLRKQRSSCNMVYVMLSSDKHKADKQQYKYSTVISLDYPTNSSLIISKKAVRAIDSLFKKGIEYKRAGVIVMGLVPDSNYQLNLFKRENPKHTSLMFTIDELNKKYRDYKIKLGSQDLKYTWKMRQEHLSPRYTTHINDIIKVKC